MTKKPKGQSLIEGIIAIFIIITGVISTLVLVLAAFSGSIESEEQVRATNFAREAQEVVRNKRDSNWLASVAFDNGLTADYITIGFSPSTKAWDWLAPVPTGFDPLSCQSDLCRLYYHSDTGVYNHVTTDGQPTNFYRIIQFNEICCNNSNCTAMSISENGLDCSGEFYKIGIQVLANVSYQTNTQTRSIVLEDRIMDWK